MKWFPYRFFWSFDQHHRNQFHQVFFAIGLLALVADTFGNHASRAVSKAAGCGLVSRFEDGALRNSNDLAHQTFSLAERLYIYIYIHIEGLLKTVVRHVPVYFCMHFTWLIFARKNAFVGAMLCRLYIRHCGISISELSSFFRRFVVHLHVGHEALLSQSVTVLSKP